MQTVIPSKTEKMTEIKNHHVLSPEELDSYINNLLKESSLTRDNNHFFIRAKKTNHLSLTAAINVAFHWREITKQFMFTTLIGLGTLAEKISALYSPPNNLIRVLQTGIAVISDDLNNVSPVLQEKAPIGEKGVHYIWWENSILNPLIAAGINKEITYPSTVLPRSKKLLDCMEKLSKSWLGSALQLRVVEDIALDIALAYRALFPTVVVDGKNIFPQQDDIAWINSHIKAEILHRRQVTDHDNGMMHIITTEEEQIELLSLAKDYIHCWAGALEDFNQLLND